MPCIYTEYGTLREAVVCEPTHVRIKAPLNAVQEHFLTVDPPDLSRVPAEYEAWSVLLRRQRARLHYLPPADDLPSQTYTRDIGFVIGETLYVGTMKEPLRVRETDIFLDWLQHKKLPHVRLPSGILEGGDVLVDYPNVYVGMGVRSNAAGVAGLRAVLPPDWQLIAVPLARGVLHLDCVCTIIGARTVIWCPELIASNQSGIAGNFDDCIEVTQDEYFHMAVNVLLLDPQTVCVESAQVRLQGLLQDRGFTVHAVAWTELKKLGGLFRCATLPVIRD